MKVLSVGGTTVQAIEGEAIRCILPWKADVGESPVWHPKEHRLFWIDIQNRQVHRFDPLTSTNETFELPEIVTCIQIRESGGLICTLKKQFAFFDPRTGALERLASVEESLPGNRFNDGKCDPQGRFWAGTMNATQWNAPSGHLFRLDAKQELKTTRSGVVCANGSGWSPDGRTMYHTESFRYAIFLYDFDPTTGDISGRRTYATVDPDSGGFPDGMTVDAEGFVWSNIVGLGQIRRYDPAGVLERVVQMPVPRATDCTFGGDGLTTLFITSARETMSADQLRDGPLSGSLFALDCGIAGLPTYSFTG